MAAKLTRNFLPSCCTVRRWSYELQYFIR